MTPFPLLATRRAFLTQAGAGLRSFALASLLNPAPAAGPGAHFPARAKRVIFLTMAGGPSHLETFDPKPTLARLDGQPMPESFTRGQPIAQLQGQKLHCLRPLLEFRKCGRS